MWRRGWSVVLLLFVIIWWWYNLSSLWWTICSEVTEWKTTHCAVTTVLTQSAHELMDDHTFAHFEFRLAHSTTHSESAIFLLLNNFIKYFANTLTLSTIILCTGLLDFKPTTSIPLLFMYRLWATRQETYSLSTRTTHTPTRVVAFKNWKQTKNIEHKLEQLNSGSNQLEISH